MDGLEGLQRKVIVWVCGWSGHRVTDTVYVQRQTSDAHVRMGFIFEAFHTCLLYKVGRRCGDSPRAYVMDEHYYVYICVGNLIGVRCAVAPLTSLLNNTTVLLTVISRRTVLSQPASSSSGSHSFIQTLPTYAFVLSRPCNNTSLSHLAHLYSIHHRGIGIPNAHSLPLSTPH